MIFDDFWVSCLSFLPSDSCCVSIFPSQKLEIHRQCVSSPTTFSVRTFVSRHHKETPNNSAGWTEFKPQCRKRCTFLNIDPARALHHLLLIRLPRPLWLWLSRNLICARQASTLIHRTQELSFKRHHSTTRDGREKCSALSQAFI